MHERRCDMRGKVKGTVTMFWKGPNPQGMEVPMTEHEELMKEVVAFLIEKALSEKPSGSYYGGQVTVSEFEDLKHGGSDD